MHAWTPTLSLLRRQALELLDEAVRTGAGAADAGEAVTRLQRVNSDLAALEALVAPPATALRRPP
jgi:hypothetical protein